MAKRLALAAVLAGTLMIAAAYGSAFLPGGAPGWAAWSMGFGTAVVMVASMALGAARDGRIGRLKLPFAIVFLIVAGGFAAVLAMPATEAPGVALVLGLPVRAAIVLVGIGLLPLVVLPIAYALTFEEMTLSDADLERIRRAARELRGEPAPAARAPAVENAPAEVEAV